MKISPMTAELFHAEWRRGGRDEANSQFSQYFERA